MAFQIQSEEAERMLRELQEITGESPADAVSRALEERLLRERGRVKPGGEDIFKVMEGVWARLAQVPNRDPRPDDEILGYGEDGLPH